jgi:hypothetical protein
MLSQLRFLGNHAEQCSRLEPRYVDVAVKRWELFTGKKAKRAKR